MAEVINRIRKDKLAPEEFKYVSDLNLYEAYYENQTEHLKKEFEAKLASQKKQVEHEKQKAEREKQKNRQLQIKWAESMLIQGKTIQEIAETLDISIQEANDLVDSLQKG